MRYVHVFSRVVCINREQLKSRLAIVGPHFVLISSFHFMLLNKRGYQVMLIAKFRVYFLVYLGCAELPLMTFKSPANKLVCPDAAGPALP